MRGIQQPWKYRDSRLGANDAEQSASRPLSRPSPSANPLPIWKADLCPRARHGRHSLPTKLKPRPKQVLGRRGRFGTGVMSDTKLGDRVKSVLIGKSRDLSDKSIFHKLSLIAFFAWVGLGADGLSSSCYGPEEAFKALNGHIYLSLIVAAASVVTVFVISASYSQIIEMFPTGGGGYLVASKLLSPTAGVVSGSALLIDYVLTITISVASGADALFSLLPASGLHYKLIVEVAVS